jgi:hypothetical protein
MQNGTSARSRCQTQIMAELPVDGVFETVRGAVPDAHVERLTVVHPGDDDNVWWIWTGPVRLADAKGSVQIDTHVGGAPPFLIEGDLPGQQVETSSVDEAAALIVGWL